MKHYELMFIVQSTLTEEESSAKFDSIQKVITDGGGEIVAPVDFGVRQLAYPIEKQKRGHYYQVYFKADGAVNKELERVFKITEEVLRFMVVKFEKKHEIANWDKQVKKVTASAKAEEPKNEEA